jgi:hypothetical protein
MSLELWDLRAFLFGALAGSICVLGLSFGTSLLMAASRDDLSLSAKSRKLRKTWGFLIVIGQFFGAFGTTAYYLKSTDSPAILPLAVGIVVSIFTSSAIANAARH